MTNTEITNLIADEFEGKAWIKNDIYRVYLAKRGYATIEKGKVNIDLVNRNQFNEVKTFCNDKNIACGRW